MKKSNLIIVGIRCVFALTCIGALAGGIWVGLAEHELAGSYFMTALTSCVSLLITFAPDFVSHKDIIMMPAVIQVVFSIFTFCAMFLGEILHFYDRFAWWDIMLHFTSGIMFSMIGLMLFVSLNRKKEVRSQLNPIGTVLFAVCFSITCGAVWEVFEFAGDTLLGMNMQRWQTGIPQEEWSMLQNMSNLSNPGLINTMRDIIADAFGSLLSIVFLLPLVRHGCNYQKAGIPTSKLLEEWQSAYAALQMGRQSSIAAHEDAVSLQPSKHLSDSQKDENSEYNAA